MCRLAKASGPVGLNKEYQASPAIDSNPNSGNPSLASVIRLQVMQMPQVVGMVGSDLRSQLRFAK